MTIAPPTERLIDFRRTPRQGAFVGTRAHEAAFVGGIGSGKTYAGCVRAFLASQGTIGKHRLQVPNLGAITAPTYPMLRDATQRVFMSVADGAIKRFNRSEGVMEMRNGSEIIFRSTDSPDRLRGPSLAWWFGDEAALYEREVWPIMVGRLRQFGQRGYAWIATTPRGRNWVWQVFVQDAQPGRRLYRAFSADNVYLDPSIIEAWRATYSGDFAAQELEGEFIAFEGLIYPEFRREVHITSSIPQAFAQVIVGVDWGFANPGVMLIIGLDSDGRAWVIAEHYRRQQRVEEWAKIGIDIRDTWHPTAFYCDPSEPDYIKTLRAGLIPAEPANNAVNQGLQIVKNRLVIQGDGKPRLFIRRDCVNLVAEFESYQWAKNPYGVKDQPLKANDHALDALRYALMGVDGRRKAIEVSVSRYV